MRIPLITRFRRYTVVVDDCLEWMGARTQGGYGLIQVSGALRFAHRIAYEMANGPIPDGLEVDHLCRNRACVRPQHLEAVTPAENARRRGAAVLACVNGHPKAGNRAGTQCLVCRREQARRRYHLKKNPPRESA